jgi:hypothetical protein
LTPKITEIRKIIPPEIVLPPLILTGVFITFAAVVSGVSLGPAIAGFFAVTLVLPPLTAGRAALAERLMILAAAVAPVAIAWLHLIGPAAATVFQWLGLSILLAAYAAALVGIVYLLERLKIPPLLASALTVLLALAWLTWPVWLSPYLSQHGSAQLAGALVRLHPPLVANGLLTFTPPWTEQGIAYRLTVLNQDISISLPASPLAAIGFHAVLAAPLLAGLRRNLKSEI